MPTKDEKVIRLWEWQGVGEGVTKPKGREIDESGNVLQIEERERKGGKEDVTGAQVK